MEFGAYTKSLGSPLEVVRGILFWSILKQCSVLYIKIISYSFISVCSDILVQGSCGGDDITFIVMKFFCTEALKMLEY